MNVNPFSYLIEKLKSKFDKTGGNITGNVTIDRKDGTVNTVGVSTLYLGSYTLSTQDKNSRGRIVMYGENYNCVKLLCNPVAFDRDIMFPDASGTIALTSDLGGVSHELKKSNASGVLTYQLSIKTIHVMEFSNATYHVLVNDAFAYHSDKKIGGDTLTLSYDNGTGILTISGVRENTNAYIAKWSI